MKITRKKWDPSAALDAAREGGSQGVKHAGEAILEEANRTVPRETGELARSGVVHVDPETLVASVNYDSPYAIAQHEGDFRHPAPGRKKWLELTLNDSPRVVMGQLEADLRAAFEKVSK